VPHHGGTQPILTELKWSLVVAYPVNQHPMKRTFHVGLLGYNSHPEGSGVPVVYDPQDPTSALLANGLDQDSGSNLRFWIYVFVACAVVMLAATWWLTKRYPFLNAK
jgi:hypothetical protein